MNENSQNFIFLPDEALGIFHLWVVYSKRAGIPKGTALPWREESNETGDFVAHNLARKV